MINKLNENCITLVSLHCYTKMHGQTKHLSLKKRLTHIRLPLSKELSLSLSLSLSPLYNLYTTKRVLCVDIVMIVCLLASYN
jgi:hypothetical protein